MEELSSVTPTLLIRASKSPSRATRATSLMSGFAARAFDRFEQTRGGAVTGSEGDRRFGQRGGGIVRDHRGAHARVIGAIVKNDFRFADLNATAGGQGHSAFNSAAVVKRAVCGTQILEEILLAFAAHFGVHARRERIGNTQDRCARNGRA